MHSWIYEKSLSEAKSVKIIRARYNHYIPGESANNNN